MTAVLFVLALRLAIAFAAAPAVLLVLRRPAKNRRRGVKRGVRKKISAEWVAGVVAGFWVTRRLLRGGRRKNK